MEEFLYVSVACASSGASLASEIPFEHMLLLGLNWEDFSLDLHGLDCGVAWSSYDHLEHLVLGSAQSELKGCIDGLTPYRAGVVKYRKDSCNIKLAELEATYSIFGT